jgi:hypothetical protein
MRNPYSLLIAAIAFSMLLAACGGTPSTGPSAADLAATQQSLEATQQALNAQPAPTDEPPTAAPATEEPTSEAPPVVEAEAFYTEEFDQIPDTWSYFLFSGDDVDLELFADGGKLVWDISGTYVWPYYMYDAYTYTDVRVDAEAENLGVNNNSVSLICRENERGWYEFNVSSGGLYNILRYEESTGDYTALYTGGVANLRTGKDTNTYTIICEGDRLTLGVNGTEIRTVEDGQFDEGFIGISVASFDDPGVLVEVEYVTISTP